jgi:hypothetical protein
VNERSVGTVQVLRPQKRPRGPSVVVGLLVGFVVIAVLKPWSIGTSPREPSAGASVATSAGDEAAASEIASTPEPSDPNGMACLADRGVQVLTLQRSDRGEVRSWVVLGDVPTSSSPDPRATPLVLYSQHIVGISICTGQLAAAPESTRGPTGIGRAVILGVRVVRGSGPSVKSVDTGPPVVISMHPDVPDAAIVYGPPAASPAGGAATSPPGPNGFWAPGSYVLGYAFETGGPSVVQWFRLDIRPTLALF